MLGSFIDILLLELNILLHLLLVLGDILSLVLNSALAGEEGQAPQQHRHCWQSLYYHSPFPKGLSGKTGQPPANSFVTPSYTHADRRIEFFIYFSFTIKGYPMVWWASSLRRRSPHQGPSDGNASFVP
ncbi:MAG: hypothetical protein KJZ78_05595, partial [Bryobacteraceae bacterium]|nr:hypothetical protein [Bryobacteraceae bacterium]